MKKTTIIRLIIYSLAIGIPILSMINCSGWGTNDMKVDQCFIDTPILREISENCYAILFFSSFLFGLPIAIYAGVVLLVVEGPIFLVSKLKNTTTSDKKYYKPVDHIESTKKEKISPFVIIPFAALAFIVLLAILSL